MDVVERRLRELLADDRLDLVPQSDAVAVVHRGVRRRRRQSRVAVTAAAVVATAAAVVGAVVTPTLLDRQGRHDAATLMRPLPSRDWSVGTAQPLPADLAGVSAFAVSDGVVWVGAPGRLVRLDTTTGGTTSYAVDGVVQSVAATPRHVWVAAVSGTGCRLEEHDPAGPRRHVFALPCAPDAQVSVTANGPHAWVLTGTPARVALRLYDAATPTVLAAAPIPGGSIGGSTDARPLAIGGDSVYVLTADGAAARLTRLQALTLTGRTAVTAPAGTRRLAYGSGRLLLAGPAGLFATAAGPGEITGLGDQPAADVTTGNDLVWSVVDGPVSSDLVARDVRTGRRVGDVVLRGRVTALVADATAVWALVQQGGQLSVVPITPH